jgi:hypothetical protein
VKALTVQQPWAWAIIHGGKDVENRTQLWKYRGLLVIHAGARWSTRGAESPLVVRAAAGKVSTFHSFGDPFVAERDFEMGAIIGFVDLVGTGVRRARRPDAPADQPSGVGEPAGHRPGPDAREARAVDGPGPVETLDIPSP